MRKLVFAIMVTGLAASTAALTLPEEDELDQFKEAYNNQTEEVPGFVGSIVGGERVNFKLEVDGSNKTLGAVFDGVEIENISRSGIEDPTLVVWTDNQTVSTVLESEEVYSALRQGLEEDDIDYETRSTTAGIKVTVLETISGIADFVGLEL